VHDRPRRALHALVGALDQLLAALHEHLDGDVVGDAVLLDQLAHEVEVGLAGRGEADLDLLEAHRTSSSNMRSLRVGSIGSMSAWLPSRRSTEHHSGAVSIVTFGQVRSVSTIGTNGVYFSKGIGVGVTFWGGIGFSPVVVVVLVVMVVGVADESAFTMWLARRDRSEKARTPRPEGGGCGRTRYVALALRKQKEAVAQHRRQVSTSRGISRSSRAGPVRWRAT
jgi:hypothetical protein